MSGGNCQAISGDTRRQTDELDRQNSRCAWRHPIEESFMVIEHAHDEPAQRPGLGADPLSLSALDDSVTTRPLLDVREARS